MAAREKNDKKLFSFAFVRLMEPGGATLQDGPHELYIYKCEDRSKLDSLSYLSLPSSGREPNAIGNSKKFSKVTNNLLPFSKIKREDFNSFIKIY